MDKPARSRKPKLPKFSPVFTFEQIDQMEHDYNKDWGVRRRMVLAALTRTPAQLAEGFAEADGDHYGELLENYDAFKRHCEAHIELAECATARMLAIGSYIVNTRGDTKDRGNRQVSQATVQIGRPVGQEEG